MRVMLGGWTRSPAARSPTVWSPLRNSAASTAIWLMLSSLSGCRFAIRRRRRRITETRSSLASPASVRATFSTVGMSLA